MSDLMNEVAELQKGWDELQLSGHMTKKAMLDLVIPFRDKYGLKDSQALQIARAELSIPEINDLLNKESED